MDKYLTRAEAIAAGEDIPPLNRKEAVLGGAQIAPMSRKEAVISEGKESGGTELTWLHVVLEIRDENEFLDIENSFITGYEGNLPKSADPVVQYVPNIMTGSDLHEGFYDIFVPVVEHLAMISFKFNGIPEPGIEVTVTKNGVTNIVGDCYSVNKNDATILVNVKEEK